MTQLEALLTVDAAAAMLGGIHNNTVRRMIDRGELPAVRVGRRRMVDPRDLREYVAARKTSVNSEGPVRQTEPLARTSAGGVGGHAEP